MKFFYRSYKFFIFYLSLFFFIALLLVSKIKNVSNSALELDKVLSNPPYNHENDFAQPLPKLPNSMSEHVRDAINSSWAAYKSYAWGLDEVNVISRKGSTWMNSALTIIDSLDTLQLAGFTEEYKEGKEFFIKNIKFTSDNDHVNVFETTIRILGGLLAIYQFDKDPGILEELNLLGSKLAHAFDTPKGIPYSDLNFRKAQGHAPSWTSYCSLSEMSSIQLEFNELSRLTGNYNFTKLSMHVIDVLMRRQQEGDSYLLPIMVSCEAAIPDKNSAISLGSRGDSFYEYLLKTWIQTGRTMNRLKASYMKSIDDIRKHLLKYSFPNRYAFVGEILRTDVFHPKMDHLVCFLPGTLAYGTMHGMPKDHLALAEELMLSCYQLYNTTLTGLSPEIVFWNVNSDPSDSSSRDFFIKPQDAYNILRPETVESLFYLYRITRKPVYKSWAWNIFKSFDKHSRISPLGFTGLSNVEELDSLRIDKMESFWMAETLKYFLLIFDDEVYSRVKLSENIFNTEGHPFKLSFSSVEINKWKRAMDFID